MQRFSARGIFANLCDAKMREDIAEQLGVTPTPGGLEILLRQSENNRMASGGIVNMNKGGAALSVLSGMLNPGGSSGGSQFNPTPMLIAGINSLTGGLFPMMKWGANTLAANYGGTGIRERLLNELGKNYDPFGDYRGVTTDQYYDAIDNIENMSTDQLQKEIEGYQVGEGTLPAQDMSAGMSGASALMAMPTYSAMYNVGGSSGHGKGAGGNFGQTQRMITKEKRKIKQRAKQYDQFGDENWYLSEGYAPEQANYYANTFKNMYGSGQNLIDTMHDRGFGQGAYDAFERVAESPPESGADSKGRPQNWSEIFAHYQETGSFDDSPEAQWGGG